MTLYDVLKYDIIDGECKCELKIDCEAAINRVYNYDRYAFGEWIAADIEDRAGRKPSINFAIPFSKMVGEASSVEDAKKKIAESYTELKMETVNKIFCRAALDFIATKKEQMEKDTLNYVEKHLK